MVGMALMRRGLALDQCNVLEYSLHDQWVEKVFDVRTEAPTDGYAHVSLQQVIQADRKLFLKLAELTREGIQVKHDGRPCDKVFLKAMQHPDVLHLLLVPPKHLQPLRSSGMDHITKGLARGRKAKTNHRCSRDPQPSRCLLVWRVVFLQRRTTTLFVLTTTLDDATCQSAGADVRRASTFVV